MVEISKLSSSIKNKNGARETIKYYRRGIYLLRNSFFITAFDFGFTISNTRPYYVRR